MTVEAQRTNGLATAAMVCGITGLVLSFIPIIGFSSWVLGPLAIIFGIISVTRSDVSRGYSIAGIITGCITMVICFLWIAVIGAAANEAEKEQARITREIQKSTDDSLAQIGQASVSPRESQVRPEHMTLAEFSQIQRGMTYDQVVAIAGSKGQQSSQFDLGDTSMVSMEWDGVDGIATANITFNNGVVSSKMQMGLQ